MTTTTTTTYKLTIEYDGTDFHGWQRQTSERTVQGTLGETVAQMFNLPEIIWAWGASRTDAGVHARGQVASQELPYSIPPQGLMKGLNAKLPRDMAIIDCEQMDDNFNARRDSRGKEYRYQILNNPIRSPHLERYSWHIRKPLDLAAMERAASHLLGEHDFSAFRASDCSALHPFRRIDQIIIVREKWADGLITIRVKGNAFLKNMVRNITGTLVEVGRGLREPDSVKDILASRDRTQAGINAPAAGLFLWRVKYEGDGDYAMGSNSMVDADNRGGHNCEDRCGDSDD